MHSAECKVRNGGGLNRQDAKAAKNSGRERRAGNDISKPVEFDGFRR